MSLQDSRKLETISLLLNHDEKLLEFLFNFGRPALRQEPKVLIEESITLSPSNRIKILSAIDIWKDYDSGGTTLSEILKSMDPSGLVNLVRALCHLREIRNEVMHALIDDENGGFCL